MTSSGLENGGMDCSAGEALPPPLTAAPYLYPLPAEERKIFRMIRAIPK